MADPYLQLYSPTVALITFDDDSGGSQNSRINYTATTSGTYYLGAMDVGSGTGAYTISAAVSDTTPPTVGTFSPADKATGIAIVSNIVVTFSESIQRGSGNIVLKTTAGTT